MARKDRTDREHGRRRNEERPTPKEIFAVFGPNEDDAVFPPEMWGQLSFGYHLDPDHLSVEFNREPEGLVIIARCPACGGRYEALCDFRSLRVDDLEFSAAQITRVLQTVFPLLENAWIPQHAGCANEPRKHHIPRDVQRFVDDHVDLARRSLRKGDPVPPFIFLLCSDKTVHAFPLHGLADHDDDGSVERRIELSARKFAIREFARAHDLDIVAAVTMTEAWITAQPLDDAAEKSELAKEIPSVLRAATRQRVEVVLFAVVTPDFSTTFVAPITRLLGTPDEGPGDLGAVESIKGAGRSQFLDGLFATTDILPQTDEQRERGKGVRVTPDE